MKLILRGGFRCWCGGWWIRTKGRTSKYGLHPHKCNKCGRYKYRTINQGIGAN